jgi:hypothetical protein
MKAISAVNPCASFMELISTQSRCHVSSRLQVFAAILRGRQIFVLLCALSFGLVQGCSSGTTPSSTAPAPLPAPMAAIVISTVALAGGTRGTAYLSTLSASGGSGTGYTWTISSGTLPSGLTLPAQEPSRERRQLPERCPSRSK